MHALHAHHGPFQGSPAPLVLTAVVAACLVCGGAVAAGELTHAFVPHLVWAPAPDPRIGVVPTPPRMVATVPVIVRLGRP